MARLIAALSFPNLKGYNMDTKLCIDCKHLRGRDCLHPSLGHSLVDGKPNAEYASVMRVDSPTACGTIGRYFEPVEAVIYDLRDLFPVPPIPNLERTEK